MITNSWSFAAGGLSKEELLLKLSKQKVNLNAYATMLFLSDKFTVYQESQSITVIETSIEALGFKDGAIFEEVVNAAELQGFALCPIAFAPYLRLHYLDQPEGGKVTVASSKPFTSEEFPSGFYLSHSANSLWLRGYRATDDWLWSSDARLAFVKTRA